MKSNNNYLFNMSLVLLSVIIIIYLLYLNDNRINIIENYKNSFIHTQNRIDKFLQNCSNDLYYIQCNLHNKKGKITSQYRLYFDMNDRGKLKFGKVNYNEETKIFTHKFKNKDYFTNDPELLKNKNFLIKIEKKSRYYNISSSDGKYSRKYIYLQRTTNKMDTTKDYFKIKSSWGKETYIMSLLNKQKNKLLTNEELKNLNDINCEILSERYKYFLSKIIDPNFKSSYEASKKFRNYNYWYTRRYLRFKEITEESNNFCPLTHPYPFDTINKNVTIFDKDNIDYTINHNNRCCSRFPIYDINSNLLKDEVTGEELLKKDKRILNNYIKKKNRPKKRQDNIQNKCPGNIYLNENSTSKKKYSILNLKRDEKVNFDKNGKILDITNHNDIIDKDNLKNIEERSLFEIICYYDSGRTEIQGMSKSTYPSLVSIGTSGTSR